MPSPLRRAQVEKLAKQTDRVYSVVDIKEFDDEKREFTGIATTPSTDRMDDIVEPSGAKYALPIALLWQHDRSLPVGTVVSVRATKNGIEVKGSIARVESPAGLAARLDEAWQSLKTQLVRGLSIGFRPIEYSFMDNGGIHFTKWEWLELSLVTIPANAEATITAVKSFDRKHAAPGNNVLPVVRLNKSAGASATKSKPKLKPEEGGDMTIEEQIKSFKAARVEKAERMNALLEESGESGETLDAEKAEEFSTLEAEVKSIDQHIVRLEAVKKLNLEKAESVQDASGMHDRSPSRAPAIVKTTKNLEPGIGIARLAMAMYAAKGSIDSARAYAEHVFKDDIRLQSVLKAAVAAGTTTDATWAGSMVDYQNLTAEFIDFLRPRTIVGQFGAGNVPALRRVPFNVRIPGKTAAGTAAWVGEGYAKPVTKSGYEATELKWAKIAAISVITEEVNRFSDPSVQMLVRDDLAEAVIERADIDFVDPAKAVGTGASASPASITNGVTPIPSSGSDADAVRADISALWEVADATNLPASSAVYITDSKTVRNLTTMRNALGQKEFPDLTMVGGMIDGVPVIISNYVPQDTAGSLFILAFASEIYLSDDNVVTIDVSREASIVMDSAPNMNSGTPTAAQLVSMFQTNSLAIRAERYINWKKRRPQAVAYISGVNWGG